MASNSSLIAANARLDRQVRLERQLITTLDLDAPLGRLLEEIGQVVPFTAAMIFTLDGDALVLQASHSCSLQQAPHPIRLELKRVPALARAIQSSMPQVFADPGEDCATLAYLGEMFGQRLRGQAWLVVPLLVYGNVNGLHRLARELHDAVTQTLFAATLITEALPEGPP